ncbi:MAG TPA: hypothetical protein VFU12_11475 [Glycomyces sp.]|nr:hypothetical protein [Glycomyces sp.]
MALCIDFGGSEATLGVLDRPDLSVPRGPAAPAAENHSQRSARVHR